MENNAEDFVKKYVEAYVKQEIQNAKEAEHPVGSLYFTEKSTNPRTILGFGTWTQIEDRFLLCAGKIYKAGQTGGEATHVLTIEEMPSHEHKGKFGYDKLYVGNANTAVGGSYNSLIAVNSNQAHELSTPREGSGKAHNNMPPFYGIYGWIRKS